MRASRLALGVVLTLTLLAAPLAADAQPAQKVWRVTYFSALSRDQAASFVADLEGGLRDLGYVVGRNVVFEHRFADGRLEGLSDLAAEVVRLKPDVIVATYPPIMALKQSATTIPIVLAGVANPIGKGLVSSLARPGGNITGVAAEDPDIWGKRLELLKEVVPGVSRVAALWIPGQPDRVEDLKQAEEAARRLMLTLRVVPVRDADDIENAFGSIVRERVGALLVLAVGSFMRERRVLIATLAAKHRLPAIYRSTEFVRVGGLMSYGSNPHELVRRAATYVDKILKGARPADLPVEQPTRFELVVNLKAAKAIGLTVPPSVLERADEVIK